MPFSIHPIAAINIKVPHSLPHPFKMINQSLGNPIYLAYKDAGPTVGLIIPAVLLNIVAICGVFMNSFVVFVTISTKTLHGTTNFLLAMISFCEIVHQTGHTIFLWVALSGTNFIDFYTSVLLELPMLLGFNASLSAMMLAAFDRLFAVLFPKCHQRYANKWYLLSFACLSIAYGLYWDFYMFNWAKENAEKPTTGLIADALVGEANLRFYQDTATLNGITIVCYILIWIIIRREKGVTQKTNTRLMKSLLIIIVINIGGYLVSLTFYQILFILMQFMDYVTIWNLGMIPSTLLNLGAACNAPVLYWTSTEYRKAFSHYFHWFSKKGNPVRVFIVHHFTTASTSAVVGVEIIGNAKMSHSKIPPIGRPENTRFRY